MSKRIFTTEQIEYLLSNKYIEKCSNRSISFSKDFKVSAVHLYEQGMPPIEVFMRAGFEINVIGADTPAECLRRWKRIVRRKGVGGLTDARGTHGRRGRPKTKGLTETDRIKRLEAEVAYLKAENDFLAELRANKRAG